MRTIGTSVQRVEDPRILTGRGRYVDDVPCPACCTPRSCAARSRTPASAASTRQRGPGAAGRRRGLTGADMQRLVQSDAHPGAARATRSRTFYRAGRPTRCASSATRSPSSWPRAATWPRTRCDLIEVDYEPLTRSSTHRARARPSAPAHFRGPRRQRRLRRTRTPTATSTPLSPARIGSSRRRSASTATPTCRWRPAAASPTSTPAPAS